MAVQNPIAGVNAVAGLGNDYQSAVLERLFSGGNQAAVATALAAGVPTAYTGGLVLANPITSTVRLVLNRVAAAFVVAQTNAAVIGLGLGISASALAGTLTVVPSIQTNLDLTPNTPQGVLYSSASVTLPIAPYLSRLLGAVATGALTVGLGGAPLSLDLQGGIILPPGGFACILSSSAGTASSFLGSFTWSEVGL